MKEKWRKLLSNQNKKKTKSVVRSKERRDRKGIGNNYTTGGVKTKKKKAEKKTGGR